VHKVDRNNRTVAVLALAQRHSPNSQGAGYLFSIGSLTLYFVVYPLSIHGGATLAFTVNTTQIGFSGESGKRRDERLSSNMLKDVLRFGLPCEYIPYSYGIYLQGRPKYAPF